MDDLRWQWWDTVSGVPGEDELTEPKPVMTYTPTTIDPVALKEALAARALANAKPEHWARRLANVWPR